MISGDNAITTHNHDRLRRKAFAWAIADTLASPGIDTPLTVGVFGSWGVGKTSLMRLIDERLRDGPEGKHVQTLWFDAWLYARQEQSLWRALLLKITADLREQAKALLPDDAARAKLDAQLEQLEASLYRSLTLTQTEGYKVNLGAALPMAADIALRYATAGFSDLAKDPETEKGPMARLADALKGDEASEVAKLIERKSRENYLAEVRSLEQFRAAFESALNLLGIGQQRLGQAPRRLYVFIDDLDRCLPEDAVAAIEAIKLFLDLPGCIFVLGMDGEVVQSGIRARYARYAEGGLDFNTAEYLDKVIQLPFRLPPLDVADVGEFINRLADKGKSELLTDTRPFIEIAVPNNPRALKRALNVLRLAAELDGVGATPRLPDRDDLRRRRGCLAKVVLMQVCFPDAYKQCLEGGAERLLQIEAHARGLEDDPLKLAAGLSPRLLALYAKADCVFLTGADRKADHAYATEVLTLSRCGAMNPEAAAR